MTRTARVVLRVNPDTTVVLLAGRAGEELPSVALRLQGDSREALLNEVLAAWNEVRSALVISGEPYRLEGFVVAEDGADEGLAEELRALLAGRTHA